LYLLLAPEQICLSDLQYCQHVLDLIVATELFSLAPLLYIVEEWFTLGSQMRGCGGSRSAASTNINELGDSKHSGKSESQDNLSRDYSQTSDIAVDQRRMLLRKSTKESKNLTKVCV